MKYSNIDELDLEIRHLRLVHAIAQEGTLTRASDRLHLTQSALSHQLFQIEQRLGTELFLRTPRRMVMTAAGERVLSAALHVMQELEQTEGDVRQLAAHRVGTLRVTTECYTCYHWVSPLLEEFHQNHPGIELIIDPDATDDPVKALLEGQLELGIISRTDDDAGLIYEPLFNDELMLMVRPQHALAGAEYVTAEDFADLELLIYDSLDNSFIYQKVLAPAGVMPRKHRGVRLTEAMIEMIRAGLGVAVMARWAVSPELEVGKLAAVRVTPAGLRRQWRAAVCRERATVPYIWDFVRLVQNKPPTLTSGRISRRTAQHGSA